MKAEWFGFPWIVAILVIAMLRAAGTALADSCFDPTQSHSANASLSVEMHFCFYGKEVVHIQLDPN